MTALRSEIVAASATGRSRVRWKIFLMMLLLISINYIDRASLSVAMPLIGKEFDMDADYSGPGPERLLLDLRAHAGTGRHARGPIQAAHRDRMRDARVGVLPGSRRSVHQLVFTAAHAARPRRRGSTDLPGRGQVERDMDDQQRARAGSHLARRRCAARCALGSLIIAGLIAELNSWRLSFIIAGVGTILVGLWAYYYIRNHPREHPSANEAEIRYLEEAHAAEDAQSPKVVSGKVTGFFRYRSVWGMCCGWMFFNTVWYGLLTWMPNYLYKAHGFDISQLGAASFLIFFLGSSAS